MKLFLTFLLLAVHSFAHAIFIDEELRELNLKPRYVEQQPKPSTEARVRSSDPLLDVEFGVLTERQYRGLHQFYLNKSKVEYDPKRNYFMSDFLTPQMQALQGQDFDSEKTMKTIEGFESIIRGEPSQYEDSRIIMSTAQCYGTAWNNLVSLQARDGLVTPFEISFIDQDYAREYLLTDDYSIEIPKSDPLKFGDAIMMTAVSKEGHSTLVHLPIYIGFGLVFEKEDANLGQPYRTVTLKASLKGLRKTVARTWAYKGQKVVVIPRRFIGVGKPQLPKVSRVSPFFNSDSYAKYGRLSARFTMFLNQGLGGKLSPAVELITKVSFEIDTSGRGRVAPSSQRYFSPAYKNVEKVNSCFKIF